MEIQRFGGWSKHRRFKEGSTDAWLPLLSDSYGTLPFRSMKKLFAPYTKLQESPQVFRRSKQAATTSNFMDTIPLIFKLGGCGFYLRRKGPFVMQKFQIWASPT